MGAVRYATPLKIVLLARLYGARDLCTPNRVQQSLYRSEQALRDIGALAPRLKENGRMKVVNLSALITGRIYPSGNIPVTHFF